MLGKRKRRAEAQVIERVSVEEGILPSPRAHDNELDAHAVFRRHFEAAFKPIEKKSSAPSRYIKTRSEGSDDEWDGFSDGQDDTGELSNVEVIDYTATASTATVDHELSRGEMRSFMVSPSLFLHVHTTLHCPVYADSRL